MNVHLNLSSFFFTNIGYNNRELTSNNATFSSNELKFWHVKPFKIMYNLVIFWGMKSDANRILIILSMKYFWRSSFISFRCGGEDEAFGDISAGSSQTLLTFGSLDLQVTMLFDKEIK